MLDTNKKIIYYIDINKQKNERLKNMRKYGQDYIWVPTQEKKDLGIAFWAFAYTLSGLVGGLLALCLLY